MRSLDGKCESNAPNYASEKLRKLIGNVPTATAILDRILYRAEIIQITGKSYRLKDRACQKGEKKS